MIIKSLLRVISFCLAKPNILWGFTRAALKNIPANPNLALINGTIITGTNAVIQNGVLLIRGNRIEQIGNGQTLKVPKGYRTVNLHGKTVLPGFFNAHVHKSYDKIALKYWLVSGVTTVRDLGVSGFNNFTQKRDELNRNPLNARLVSATPLITTVNGFGGTYVSSAEDAKNKVTEFVKMNVDIIKIAIEDELKGQTCPMLTLDEIKIITDTAHSQGRRVAAHVTHMRNLRLAIDGGVDEISHMVVDELDQSIIDEIIIHNGRIVYHGITSNEK